jgi:hypothetical protein
MTVLVRLCVHTHTNSKDTHSLISCTSINHLDHSSLRIYKMSTVYVGNLDFNATGTFLVFSFCMFGIARFRKKSSGKCCVSCGVWTVALTRLARQPRFRRVAFYTFVYVYSW